MNEQRHKTYHDSAQSITVAQEELPGKLTDIAQLIKIRLNLTVVFSAVLSYLIVAGNEFRFLELMLLGAAGFLVTSAANAFNQVLEKDYDALMKRTMTRPIAAGRMNTTEAVLIAGLCYVAGIILLAWFNPLAAILGSIAVVSYAFVYTPLKRVGPASVFVGAIPGALPCLIGAVAFEGTISTVAIILFGIQFFWQFPHFWSIGYLGFEDYQKAGFKLVPTLDGKVHPGLGLQSSLFSLMIVPMLLAGYWLTDLNMWVMILLMIMTVVYALYGWQMYREQNGKQARKLMFYSFAYMPLALIIYYLGVL